MGGAVENLESGRADGMVNLAKRLHEGGALRVDVETATDVLWLVTSFDGFDLLYTGRRLPVPDVAERLFRTAHSTLCR